MVLLSIDLYFRSDLEYLRLIKIGGLSNLSIDSLKPINQQWLFALFLKLKLVEKVAIKMVRSSAHKNESKKPALGSNVEIIIERLADKEILHEIHQSYID